jgi:hypothetical protein
MMFVTLLVVEIQVVLGRVKKKDEPSKPASAT